jgi:bacterial/archaeal transporter family-2 protein
MNNMLTAITGALIAIMIGFNGVLSNAIGNFNSTVIIHMVGLICIIFILIITRSKISFRKNASLFLYSAGVIGVLIVLFTNISVQTLGVSLTVALGLIGQSTSSLVIDQLGLFGMKKTEFDKRKTIGFSIMLIGIVIMTVL